MILLAVDMKTLLVHRNKKGSAFRLLLRKRFIGSAIDAPHEDLSKHRLSE
jgi:hypothetical protein